MNPPEAARWKFGPFRLDTAQCLLFRDGELVPLKHKATEILKVLVENHGQLVEKDELMRRVWPDSFVEDGNLTVHIWQLRKTLADEGCDCRIETIPRRGYRLIGTVELESPGRETSVPVKEAAPANPEPGFEEISGRQEVDLLPGSDLPRPTDIPIRHGWPAAWLWACMAIAAAAVLLALGLRFLNKPKSNQAHPPGAASDTSGDRDWIVLGNVTNETGEPVFDTTLHEAMVIELEQSPYLSLVSDERMQESLRLMGKPSIAALTPELSRELCMRNGGAAVVDGSIARLGTQYVLAVKAVNCRTGDHLGDLQTTASGKEQVLKALGDITSQLRARLGESLSTVQKFDTPIEQATTSSLEALQAYSLGRQTMVQKMESAACVPYFQQAIRLDPKFAIAYAALGNAYSNLGETGLAADNTRKAYELRANVSEHERLYIESHYYQFVTGDLIKASQTYELWTAMFPNDEAPKTNLAVIDSDLGKLDKSLELAQEVVHLASHEGQSYANLVDAYNFLNRPDDANAIAAKAFALNLDSSALRLYLYDAAFLQRNLAGMEKQLTWAAGEPGVEDAFLGDQADYLATTGQLARAKDLTARAAEAAKRADEKETAAGYELDQAQREAEFGNDAEAVRSAESALTLAKDRDTLFGAALAFALAGAPQRALPLASRLDKQFPSDTIAQFIYLPSIRGAIAVHQNDPARAVQALRPPFPMKRVRPRTSSAYIRGQAYLEAKNGERAAIEFQKIIDHPGVVMIAPFGPLARLQLARALMMQGNAAQAKAAYEDFLNRWQNADQNIPILRNAKLEYARLQQTPKPALPQN